ncbi:MAG: hypothetical protein HN348_30220, partial [Proteobacteria bacterium]|nr:hypothetical protein [Pseudomonadota bacterium]
MERLKYRAYSNALKRRFHVDVFRLGVSPDVLVLHFDGSGVSEASYKSRAQSIIPVFDETLEELESEGLSLVFVFVTAPFDLGFAHFHRNPGEAARRHEPDTICVFHQGAAGQEGVLAPVEGGRGSRKTTVFVTFFCLPQVTEKPVPAAHRHSSRE